MPSRSPDPDVTIDLGGFRITGIGAGTSTQANGIYAINKQNITIRNGTVEGFFRGIYLDKSNGTSSGHLVEKIRAMRNRFAGIYLKSNGSIIRDNQVIDTGPATNTSTYGIAVQSCAGTRVTRNSVHNVTAPSSAYGIAVFDCDDSNISLE